MHSGKELAGAFAALPTPSTPQGTALRTALSTIPRTLSAAQARCKQDEASEHELPKMSYLLILLFDLLVYKGNKGWSLLYC
jgi:hypothetical protein